MQTNCILSAPVVLPIVRWSDREHLFVRKEYKVSGRLREVVKQKLSTLHASSTVRVCQLLCTAPLETFQTQVLTNNPEHRRLMNTRLPWYGTDRPVGMQLVILIHDWIINCLNVFFSAGTARSADDWSPVNCACVLCYELYACVQKTGSV